MMESKYFIVSFFILVALIKVRVDASLLSLSTPEDESEVITNVRNARADEPPSTVVPDSELVKPENCSLCKCGLTNTQNRIVGGVEANKNKYPWMAQILYKGSFYCGASVINSRYVITAAHCVTRYNITKMTIRIGDHNRLSSTEAETQDFRVAQKIVLPIYAPRTTDHDIALLKLEGVIDFGDSMRPVCFPEPRKSYIGNKGIVTGWGTVKQGGINSQVLLEVSVPIISNHACRRTQYLKGMITNNMMCAGYMEGGKDSCQGDSGGPLHVLDEKDKVLRLVGIVSWGISCGAPRVPGVYARVNRYLIWIKTNTADACYCDE